DMRLTRCNRRHVAVCNDGATVSGGNLCKIGAILLQNQYGGMISSEMTLSLTARESAAPDAAVTLSRATLRAARLLDIPQAELADIIGVSEATVSRIANGRRSLEPGSQPWQLAA